MLMSIEAFERREQILQLREKVLQAEQERLNGIERLEEFPESGSFFNKINRILLTF